MVEVNRAVAHSRAYGPEAGLAVVDAVRYETGLRRYHLLPAVRADLLHQLNRVNEAREELARATAMAPNAAERGLLQRRAAEWESSGLGEGPLST